MTKVQKSKPLPVDPVLEAREAERRELLAMDPDHQARVSSAHEQEKINRIREFESELKNLDRMKNSRGSIEARAAGYTRAYRRLERAARIVFELTGRPVEIPEFDPPAELSKKTVTISAGLPQDDRYRETKGMGPSGRGLPPEHVPGSGTDPAWLAGGK